MFEFKLNASKFSSNLIFSKVVINEQTRTVAASLACLELDQEIMRQLIPQETKFTR